MLQKVRREWKYTRRWWVDILRTENGISLSISPTRLMDWDIGPDLRLKLTIGKNDESFWISLGRWKRKADGWRGSGSGGATYRCSYFYKEWRRRHATETA